MTYYEESEKEEVLFIEFVADQENDSGNRDTKDSPGKCNEQSG